MNRNGEPTNSIKGKLQAVWQEHTRSYLPHVLINEVHPKTVLPVLAGVGILLLATYYVPEVKTFTEFDHLWIPLLALLMGGLATIAQWMYWKKQYIVQVLCLVDNCLYCIAVVAVMIDTVSPIRYVWALLYGQMAAHYGRRYAFSWPLLVSVSAIPFIITLYFCSHDYGLLALTLFGALIFIVNSTTTQHARKVELEKERYQAAYRLTDQVASESLDIAIASSMAEVGNFLHELRNAATPIVGDVLILKQHKTLHPDIEESVESLEVSTARISDLINKLLISIKGRAARQDTNFLLSEVLVADELGGGLTPVDRKNIVEISIEGTVPKFMVNGNPEHLKAAIDNLIQNASNAGADRITISASLDGGLKRAFIKVSDNGPGIPKDLISGLLLPESKSNKGIAHGLGLPLSKRLIEVLGGELKLADTGSRGTTFQIMMSGQHKMD